MTSLLDRLITSSVRCLRCGGPIGCGCGVEVKLNCPICGITRTVPREHDNPPDLRSMTFPCTACDQQDGTLPIYRAGDGSVIPLERMHP